MQTTYDRELAVELSDAFVVALHQLMAAQIDMMRKAEPDLAHCWTWGRCEVGDLASAKALTFQYGGDDDKPKGMDGSTQVVTAA